MAQNAEWFQGVFQASAKAIEADPKIPEENREYLTIYKTCLDCIRGGEHDAGYVRNQIGYSSVLPTTVPKRVVDGKTEYLNRTEAFNKIWGKAMQAVRDNVMNRTVADVWGISVKGMQGVEALLRAYGTAIEKGSTTVTFNPQKASAKVLESKGFRADKTGPSGQKTFTVPIATFAEILDTKFGTIKKDGVVVKVAEMHGTFAETYRGKLNKYAQFRMERVTVPTDLVTYDEW